MTTIDRRGVTVSATDPAAQADPNPGLAIKTPVLVATTANITLAGAQTVDGVLVGGAAERVLVKDQIDQKTNGIYNASLGNWTRAADFNANDLASNGGLVFVVSGAVNISRLYQVASADPIIVGTSAIAFSRVSFPALGTLSTSSPITGGGLLNAGLTLALIANGITYGLIQQVGASRLVGNPLGAPATAIEIPLGATLTFNGGAAGALQTAAMTGDISTSANSFVTTLATVNSNVGTFGSSTAIPNFTVNGKGLVTAAGSSAVIAPAGTLTGATLATNVTASSLLSVGASLSINGAVIGANALAVTGSAAFSGNVSIAGSLVWPGQGLIQSPSDGLVAFYNNAGTGFGRIQLGGTTASYPAIKRNGTAINLRLADDSADAPLTAGATTITGSFLATNLVTFASLQQVAASSLVGNATGGVANAAAITLGATLAFSGSALQTAAHTGDVTTAVNSFVTTVAKIAGTVVGGTTGSGNVVFGTAPVIAGGQHTALTALGIRSTGAAFDLTLATSEVLTAGRTLSIVLGDAARSLTFTGNASIGGTNTGDQTIFGRSGNVTAQADDYKAFMGLGIPYNLTLAASVAGNALTIALKDNAGANPSATSPCVIPFRNNTATAGDYATLLATAAMSFVISSGSTLGSANATPFRIWILAFNDAGTLRLGAINCGGTNEIYGLPEFALKSTTAEGGAGAAGSAGVIYTGAAVTTKAFRILGYMEWTSGLPTAGTWAAGPDIIQLFGPGVPRPGQPVQSVSNSFAAGSGGSTASTSFVDTNVAADPITLSSPVNRVAYSFDIQVSIAVASSEEFLTMSRGGVAVGPLVAGVFGVSGGTNVQTAGHSGADFPGSIGPHTYKVRSKSSLGTTTVYWNDANGGASISLAEIMG